MTVEPEARTSLVGHEAQERALRRMLEDGRAPSALLITGPPGVGKATLAFRYARAALAPEARVDEATLAVAPGAPIVRQTASGGHPDLLVLRRPTDENTGRVKQDIPVELARSAGRFFSRTAGFGGARVCIVDTADDLNTAAANALLKTLEEPPSGASFVLVSNTPSRLLATIRSRCRTLTLRPVADDAVAEFLRAETGASDAEARRIAALAAGRPGRVLELASGEGAAAADLADRFIADVLAGEASAGVALGAAVQGAKNDALWTETRAAIVDRLCAAARAAAVGEGRGGLEAQPIDVLTAAWEVARRATAAGDALKLDRVYIARSLASDLRGLFDHA